MLRIVGSSTEQKGPSQLSTYFMAGFIFVHLSGYLRRAKVRFFEFGNFLTELDQVFEMS